MYKFHAKSPNYMIVIRGINIKFSGGKFSTDDEDLANALENSPYHGLEFFRLDKPNSEFRGWKEKLKDSDKPDLWTEKTLEAFKKGENIARCKYDCGYACHMVGPVKRHEKECGNKPTE